ncbi:GGDEF domain-containing protein [Kushneria aurantia]|uniref:diguanylate cyclase n=1 Tax=Kushneria aurantia TaxID=504092 RepID=A0ABV6G138_9GAMM|nr:GGDEF domain-containing protein [Kushneria aurantia]
MLDTTTLFITGIVTRTAFMAVLLATALTRPGAHYLWHWMGALLTSTLGLWLIVQRDSGPYNGLYDTLDYALILLCFAFTWSGLRIFYGRAIKVWPMALLTILPPMTYAVLILAGMAPRYALPVVFAAGTLFSLLNLVEVATTPWRRLRAQYVIGLAYVIYAVAFSIPAILIPAGIISTDIPAISRLPLLADLAACIMLYFGYVALTGERASFELRHLSETDTLTDLANRRGAQPALQRLLDKRKQAAGASVVMADLDHFKQINDGFGHATGDSVLKVFAKRLTSLVRDTDIAARWGGEEFLIVLPATDIEAALQLAERLRRHIDDTSFMCDGQRIDITVSLGVAQCVPGDRDFEAAILRADRALYRAKHEGRNRVCWYDADEWPAEEEKTPQ